MTCLLACLSQSTNTMAHQLLFFASPKKSNQKRKSLGMILDSVSWFEEQITRMLFSKATRKFIADLK